MAQQVIHLDTSFLIRGLRADSPAHRALADPGFLAPQTSLGMTRAKARYVIPNEVRNPGYRHCQPFQQVKNLRSGWIFVPIEPSGDYGIDLA